MGSGCSGTRRAPTRPPTSGWQNQEGASQHFDRARYEVEEPTYIRVGPTARVDARTGNIFERRSRFMRQYPGVRDGTGDFDELLKAYYEKHPQDLELDILNIEEVIPKLREDRQKYGDRFLLAIAWANAMGAAGPRSSGGPPEEADFPRRGRYGGVVEPVKLKDAAATAELIKKVSHEFGSTLVGITKLNPDWVYLNPLRGRGWEDPDVPMEVPAHWEYAIVVGTPMQWDAMYANPTHGTSNDAYSRSRIIATRLAEFIKSLGYPARTHIPGNSYDLMVPPIAIDAGLGEQARPSICVTPELGLNFRPAVVTTNIPMKTDKPIDFGVQDFCNHCKVCAEMCPSGAIPMGEKVEIRGYRRWKLDTARCQNFWNSNLGSSGCRICVACCPYTRKSNWLHKGALEVTANDPTGISERALTAMQKSFYPGPDPEEYYIPSLGGSNASYREPPWWLKTEDFIELGGEG
ncbi:MAG: reductive dehalogenase [bacterium]